MQEAEVSRRLHPLQATSFGGGGGGASLTLPGRCGPLLPGGISGVTSHSAPGLCLPVLFPTSQHKLETGSEKATRERNVGTAEETASALWAFRISARCLLSAHRGGNCSQEPTQTAVTAHSDASRPPQQPPLHWLSSYVSTTLRTIRPSPPPPEASGTIPDAQNEAKDSKILTNWLSRLHCLKVTKLGFSQEL